MRGVGIALIGCLFLPACLLKQDKGPNVQSNKLRAIGAIVLEDLAGKEEGAYLVAGFARPSDRGRESVRRLFAASSWGDWEGAAWSPLSMKGLSARAEPGSTICEVRSSGREDDDAERAGLVSVGEMRFGPAYQTSLVAVPEDADHRYVLDLPKGFSSEARQVKASGAGDIPGFTAILSVPEPMPGAQAAGQAFGSVPIALDQKQELFLEWERPFVVNESNLLVLEISARDGEKRTTLLCAAYEAKAGEPVDGRLRWGIPHAYFTALPPSSDAKIYLSRAHMKTLGSDLIEIDVDSRRTWGAGALIND